MAIYVHIIKISIIFIKFFHIEMDYEDDPIIAEQAKLAEMKAKTKKAKVQK